MIHQEIAFKDFDGQDVVEKHYFNINEVEILELQVNNIEELIKRIIETNDQAALFNEFRKFILLAYGIREGTSFIKSEELSQRFSMSLAYNALVLKLATDADFAADFFIGTLPRDFNKEAINEIRNVATTQLPPPPPSTPSV